MTISNKIILEANTFPRVDIDFMNNTHFDELIIVQDLGKVILAYQQNDNPNASDTEQVSESLDGWLAHSHAHFARENALMQEVDFPMYQILRIENEPK